MNNSGRGGILAALIVLLATTIPTASLAANSVPSISSNRSFSGFDTIAFIQQNSPSLASQAETISHWAGYYRINPLLFNNVVQAQASPEALTSKSIKALAASLASLTDRQSKTGDPGSNSVQGLANELDREFSFNAETAATVIRLTQMDYVAAGLTAESSVASDTPPALDLPFGWRQFWEFNGVHTWTGDDDGTAMSAIDFTSDWSQAWGDDTLSDWVTSAHDGVVTVFSSCFVEIQHDSGWSTRYYHLDNLEVFGGQRVMAGEKLANYASERTQALCSGGNSTGPHLHFALLRDGEYQGLHDIALSGYVIHPGLNSYDSSRSDMWLEKRNIFFYAYGSAIYQQEGDNIIDYRYNGMWYSPEHNGHGLNIELTEFAEGEGRRNTVFIIVYTYDDEGQANFYAGNLDYERWRVDESMVVGMLQTAGGDFSSLAPIDFNNPDDVQSAGQAELYFFDCENAHIEFSLNERSSAQPVEHSIDLVKLIGVPVHVCEAASLALPNN